MISVVADTHAIIWYFRSPDKLSPEAIIVLDSAVNNGCFIYLSAISIIEIIYLFEKNKISEVALSQLFQFLADPDIRLKVVPINLSVGKCLTKIPRLIVPEIGDRIITATALYFSISFSRMCFRGSTNSGRLFFNVSQTISESTRKYSWATIFLRSPISRQGNSEE